MKKASVFKITNPNELEKVRREFNEKRTYVKESLLIDLYSPWENGLYVFPEEFQRTLATTWRSFGRQFVETILSTPDTKWFNPLHIQGFRDTENYGDKDMMAVVEGQQRLTWIKNFFLPTVDTGTGKPEWPNKLSKNFRVQFKYSDGTYYTLDLGGLSWNHILKQAEENKIIADFVRKVKDRRINVNRYEGFNDEEIREIFCKINTTEPLNDQEMRNAVGGIACSTIRSMARKFSKNPENLHPLFDVIGTALDHKPRWMDARSGRMNLEKLLAVVVAYNFYYDGKCDKTALDSLYEESKSATLHFTDVMKSVTRQLDVLYKAATQNGKIKESNPVVSEAMLLITCGIIRTLDKTSTRSIVIDDAWKFYSEIILFNKTLEDDVTCILVGKKARNGKQSRLDYNQIVNKGYRASPHIQFIFKQWAPFIDKVLKNPTNYGIRSLDSKRVITDKEKLVVYAQQDGKDATTQEPVSIKSVVKGHIEPHAKGNDSTIENTVLISASENSLMGTETYTNKP